MDILWEAFMRLARHADPTVETYCAMPRKDTSSFSSESSSKAAQTRSEEFMTLQILKTKCCVHEAIPARMSRAMGTWPTWNSCFL